MSGARISLLMLAGAIGLLGFGWTLSAEPPKGKGRPGATVDDENRVSLAVAKDRAKLMHDIYSSTLDSMHHHFFRRDRAVLPARALDDVFKDVDRKTGIKSRWISVNTPAMSINHEPETDFEKKAAELLAEGKAEHTATEKGYYLRATPIPLGSGCVSCHTKFGATDDKKPRFAGLVISIPIKDE
jgi:hypothetical protein